MKTPNPKTTKAQKPKRKPREWIVMLHNESGGIATSIFVTNWFMGGKFQYIKVREVIE